MNPELLFKAANMAVLPGWLLLIIIPGHRLTRALVHSGTLPLAFALLYTALLLGNMQGAEGGFSTLAGVSALFKNPWLLLAGWVHYLAFDLFTGAWIARDSLERGISLWFRLPCLAATFLAGPMGLLLYFLIRFGYDSFRKSRGRKQ